MPSKSDLEKLMNSQYSPLTPAGRAMMDASPSPTEYIKSVANGKKSEKAKEKERIKSRIANLQSQN